MTLNFSNLSINRVRKKFFLEKQYLIPFLDNFFLRENSRYFTTMSATRRRSSGRSPDKSRSRNISGTRSEGEMSHGSDAAFSEPRRRSSSRTDQRMRKPKSTEKAAKNSGE